MVDATERRRPQPGDGAGTHRAEAAPSDEGAEPAPGAGDARRRPPLKGVMSGVAWSVADEEELFTTGLDWHCS